MNSCLSSKTKARLKCQISLSVLYLYKDTAIFLFKYITAIQITSVNAYNY